MTTPVLTAWYATGPQMINGRRFAAAATDEKIIVVRGYHNMSCEIIEATRSFNFEKRSNQCGVVSQPIIQRAACGIVSPVEHKDTRCAVNQAIVGKSL